MPTLIVEDGSLVANANTYVDLTYLSAFASDRNLTIPTDNTVKENYILRAMDYIESLADRFIGVRYTEDQALQWPRSYVYIDGYLKETDFIPPDLKKAVCQLVVEQEAGNPLTPEPLTESKLGLIVSEKIGPLETTYSSYGRKTANSAGLIVFASVNKFLQSLLNSSSRVYRA